MRSYHIIIVLIVFFAIYFFRTVGCLGNDIEKKPMKEIKDLPSKFCFFSTDVNSNLPYFVRESAFWPDEKYIKEKRAEKVLPEVKASIESTLYWLKKVIKEQWLPEDIEQRLIPLQESLKGDDAIWTRYQINDYAIQIVTDFGRIRLFVRPVDKKSVVSVKDKKEMDAFILKAVEMFLQKSDIVKQKLPEAQESQGVAVGIPISDSKRAPNLWWEQVRWWSDGGTIAFWIPKTDERTSIMQPSPKKHWFSKP